MLQVNHLRKIYQRSGLRVTGAADVSFEVPDGAFFTLLGPSGCGKTTTLRSVAGLERPDEGDIQIGDHLVFSSQGRVFVPPHRRRLSMVFQSYAIWPHMNVAQNVAYPLEARGISRAEIGERVREVLRMVDLAGLEERPATDLSGGQQQRVAVARAIIANGDVLLLDEPLSNVDTRLRVQMRDELRALQQRLKVTTLYVTHDQEEALAVSDMIAVMDAGRIVELGAPAELYRAPSHRFTAAFIGHSNLLPARVVDTNGTYARVSTPLGELTCLKRSAQPGQELDLCVRPEDLELISSEDGTDANVLHGTVSQVTFLGAFTDCRVRVKSTELQLRLHPRTLPSVGDEVGIHIPPDHSYCVL